MPKSLLSEFSSLQNNLAKASLMITFEAYMGLTVFTSIVSGALSLSLSFLISQSIVDGVLVGVIVFFLSYLRLLHAAATKYLLKG